VKGHAIKARFAILSPFLNERLRRMIAAAEVLSLGHGGASIVSKATGVSFRAIRQGKKELRGEKRAELPVGRVRKKGGGRKRTVEKDATLKSDLEALVEPATRGDPESPLRWTCKSIRKLAEELQSKGHQTSHRMVRELPREMGYSLQANRKTLEGSSHADRNGAV
jgi:transposase